MRFLTTLLAAVALLPSLCSCIEKDWDVATGNAVSLNISLPEGKSSSALQLIVYSEDSLTFYDRGFLTPKEPMSGSFDVNLLFRPGKYCLACHNFDVSDTFLRGELSLPTVCFYTYQVNDVIKKNCGKEGQDLYNTPDEIIFGVKSPLDATMDDVAVSLDTKSIVEHWTVDVPVEGIVNVGSAGILLCGQEICSYPGNPKAEIPSGMAWCALSVDIERKCVSGTFNTFGAADGAVENAIVTVVDKAGKPLLFEMKPGALASARDAGSFNLAPDAAIVVPEPEGQQGQQGGGGFQPEVGEWNYLGAEIYI